MFESHPIKHILNLKKHNEDAIFEFSIYKYEPQSVFDERKVFTLESCLLTEEWLSNQLSMLEAGWELAIHSKLIIDRRTYHIPLIDLDCAVENFKYGKECLRKVLPRNIFVGLDYYSSGRSFHVYGNKLLQPGKWHDFMGRLLLANFPAMPSVVDARWIGHRIIGGYGSLRLSQNTNHYLGLPEKVLDGHS